MKTKLIWISMALALCSGLPKAAAQGTAFTYQGRLSAGGNPANGNYDLTFALFNSNSTNSGQAGNTLTNFDVGVTNGLFTVLLDFSDNFPGASRWLAIGVRTNGGGSFTALNPLQELTPAPYAIYAEGVDASNIIGTISAANFSGSYVYPVALNNPSNAFAGNGSNLTGVNAAQLDGLSASNFWQTGGNAGTTPGLNFVGTTDNQAVELHVNGGRALRLEPNSQGAPNVIGGSGVNYVTAGVVGAAIGGGGATNSSGAAYTNGISSDFSTIAGGAQNFIETNSFDSTIGGGAVNLLASNAFYSTISGGFGNLVDVYAAESFIGGGYENIIQGNSNLWATGYLIGNVIVGGGFNEIVSNAASASIGGGQGNSIGGWFNTIAGGADNAIEPGAESCLISGGAQNTIESNALESTIIGGFDNNISTNSAESVIGGGFDNAIASGAAYSTIGGGRYNTVSGAGGTVPGGERNSAKGINSFAAGTAAQATNDGSFVLTDFDAANTQVFSTASNQLSARFRGGIVFVTGGAGMTLDGPLAVNGQPVLTNLDASQLTSIGNPGGGLENFFLGEAGNATTTGENNTASGFDAFIYNTSGYDNTATGTHALEDNTTGYWNTACGTEALESNTNGGGNTAIGLAALGDNTSGNQNTATGYAALAANTTGEINTATGAEALISNTNGTGNTATGFLALAANTSGSYNIAEGDQAGFNITGSSNIDIGNKGVQGENNTIRIGTNQTSAYLAGVYGANPSGGVPVFVNSTGQLGSGGTIGNSMLANSSIAITAGTGLSGGGAVALGSSINLNNTGVLSLAAGSDFTLSSSTGAITLGDTATSANTAGTIVKRDGSGNFSAGTITVTGLLVSGSGTGTTDLPSPSGLVLRRINSLSLTIGNVVARTDVLTLERDGSNEGLLIRYPAGVAKQTINCVALSYFGTNILVHATLNGGSGGTIQLLTSAQHAVHASITFGNTYNESHVTQVVLDRYDDGSTSDFYWVGTLTSTYNQ